MMQGAAMDKCIHFYELNKKWIRNLVFPLIIAIWPLLRICQGLSTADTMYSLSNYEYFPVIRGPWMQATYLSNVLGYLLMRLPGGGTVMGMYFYTGLVLSVILLTVYYMLRGTFSAPLVFVGEMAAVSLCWCPTTLLYNYLTYLFMTLGILFLWKAITENERRRACRLFISAGLCLGLNTMVRMANAAEAVLIIAVWIGVYALRRKNTVRQILRTVMIDSICCMAGWAAGFLIPYAAICVQYGTDAYGNMIDSMFSMTSQATDYKFTSMFGGIVNDYAYALKWFLPMAACIAVLTLLERFFSADRIKDAVWRGLSAAAVILWIRFCWGRGMFTYHYYEYRAMYFWAVLFLTVTIVTAVFCLCSRSLFDSKIKIFAMLVLIEIFITPVGSNNALYPIINNLFLAVPFTLWMCRELWNRYQGQRKMFPAGCAVCGILVMFMIQSAGFYFGFALQDGVWGSPRTAKTSESYKTAGVYTTEDNAAQLDGLFEYAGKSGLAGRSVIAYGDVPGAGYLLDMPPALSTYWPSLPSYQINEWKKDMSLVKKAMGESGSGRPVVITSGEIAAYIDCGGEGMCALDVDGVEIDKDMKLKELMRFLRDNGYTETFNNGQFTVYE